MRFEINRALFAESLARAATIADRRSVQPVLKNALLRAASDALTVAAANDAQVLVDRVPCKNGKAGALTVEAKRLADIVAALDGEDVQAEVKDRVLTIRCGKARFSLPGISEADFPKLPTDIKPAMKIDAGALRDALIRTAPCSSPDISRAHLNGVAINGFVAAADGQRMMIVKRAHGIKTEAAILVPRQSLSGLIAFLDGQPECSATILEGRIAFFVGNRVLCINLSAASPAPFSNFVRETSERVALVNCYEAAAVLGRALKLSPNGDGVRIDFTADVMAVSVKSEFGDAEESLAIEYHGEPLAIGVNAQFLAEAIDSLGTERARISMTGALDSIEIRPAENDSQVIGISPMRL